MSYPNVLARRPDRLMPLYGRAIGLAVSTVLLASLLPPAAQSLAMLADQPRAATPVMEAAPKQPELPMGGRSASIRLLQESTLRAVRDGVVEAADARDLAGQLRNPSATEPAVIQAALRRFRSTLPEPENLSSRERRRIRQVQALLDLCLQEAAGTVASVNKQ